MLNSVFLTFFFSGYAKKAPGTVGSLASILFWFLLNTFFHKQGISIFAQNIFWIFFLVTCFCYGILAIPAYAKKVGEIDHKSIVLDETVGQILPLQASFYMIHQVYFSQLNLIFIHIFLCFVIFRFLDITKPSFIGYCDRNFKNSLGVMLDDLLCGIITTICVIILIPILS